MPVLEARDVSVRFGGVNALVGAGFHVEPGDLLGFIGPNGVGKTTLMRVITGLVRPDSGDVLFEGRSILRWPVHARVRAGLGLAQQIVRPFRSMTLLDNVAIAVGMHHTARPLRALARVDRSRERLVAGSLLEMVGIDRAAGLMPAEVSLGTLKRLEVARALALEPRVLLLDEPLAGLNQVEARAMADFIRSLVDADRSIVMIEHNLREVVRICPRLYVQDNGRPLAFGPTAAVMADPQVRAAYLGQAADA